MGYYEPNLNGMGCYKGKLQDLLLLAIPIAGMLLKTFLGRLLKSPLSLHKLQVPILRDIKERTCAFTQRVSMSNEVHPLDCGRDVAGIHPRSEVYWVAVTDLARQFR